MSVFLDGDVREAQKLIEEKARFRDLEHGYVASHIARLQDNTAQSIETSSLHLDLISDLKRINSHICSIAYPILQSAGALRPTRLRRRSWRRWTTPLRRHAEPGRHRRAVRAPRRREVHRRAGDAAGTRAADRRAGRERRRRRCARHRLPAARPGPPAARAGTTPRPCAAWTTCISTSRCLSCAGCSTKRCWRRSSCTWTPSATCARRGRATGRAVGRLGAQPGAAGRRVRCRAGGGLHRPAGRRGRGAAAPVGRPGQAAGAATAPLAHYLAIAARPHCGPAAGWCAVDTDLADRAAVLFGALLHAGWNALIKSGSDKASTRCWCISSAPWLPCRCCCGWACRGPRPGPTSPRRCDPCRLLHCRRRRLRARRPGPDLSDHARLRAVAGGAGQRSVDRRSARRRRPGWASSASAWAWRWSGFPSRPRPCIMARRWRSPLPTPSSSRPTRWSMAWACACRSTPCAT